MNVLALQEAKWRLLWIATNFSEVASQYLDRAIILLTVAGEERLALDIEEWMECVELSSASSEPKNLRVS